MKKLTREWVTKAEADFQVAETLSPVRPPVHDARCFHCQQAVSRRKRQQAAGGIRDALGNESPGHGAIAVGIADVANAASSGTSWSKKKIMLPAVTDVTQGRQFRRDDLRSTRGIRKLARESVWESTWAGNALTDFFAPASE